MMLLFLIYPDNLIILPNGVVCHYNSILVPSRGIHTLKGFLFYIQAVVRMEDHLGEGTPLRDTSFFSFSL